MEALEADLERLRREQAKHSGNSGRPPSSDTVTQRSQQAEERLSRAERRRRARAKAKELMKDKPKRRPGKQPGEAGTPPTGVEVHRPERCGGCGGELADAEVVASERRQVFDLPRRRLEVTEHRAEPRRCGCGRTTKAPFPPEAKAPTAYGPLVRSVGVYLLAGQLLPVARAGALLAQVCGAPMSTGWLAGLTTEAAGGPRGLPGRAAGSARRRGRGPRR